MRILSFLFFYLNPLASYKAVNATPNLNVPANRRFQSDPMEAEEVMDMKTVNALATLRRQNVNPSATKRLGNTRLSNSRR